MGLGAAFAKAKYQQQQEDARQALQGRDDVAAQGGLLQRMAQAGMGGRGGGDMTNAGSSRFQKMLSEWNGKGNLHDESSGVY